MGKTCDDILAWLIAAEAAVPAEERPYGSYDYTIAIHHLEDPDMAWRPDSNAQHVLSALWEAIPAVDWAGYHIAEALHPRTNPWPVTPGKPLVDILLAALVRTINPDGGTVNESLLDYLTTEQQQAIAERLLASIREAK